ncbi:hypothetical protein [Shewanella sp. 30m-9]
MANYLKTHMKTLVLRCFYILIRHIRRASLCCVSAIGFKANSLAIELFPENKLYENSLLSGELIKDIIDLESSKSDVNPEQYELLKERIQNTNVYKELMTNYLLLELKLNKHMVFSDTQSATLSLHRRLKEILGENPPPEAKLSVLRKSAIKSKKIEKANYFKVRDEYIETKKTELIKPIDIESAHLTILITMFSALFLCGGFLYTKYLFWKLDVEVAKFFTISDYLSSSIDVVFGAVIATLIFFVFFIKGASSRLHTVIHNDQYKIESKSKDWWIYIVIPMTVLSIFTELYTNSGKSLAAHIALLSVFVLIETVGKIRIERYVKNFHIVILLAVVLSLFCVYLVLKANSQIRDLKSTASADVSLQLKNEYKQLSTYKLITVNSGYAFLYGDNKVIVIPKDAVQYYTY